MRKYTTDNPEFQESIDIVEETDTGHADNLTPPLKQLLQNTLVLKNGDNETGFSSGDDADPDSWSDMDIIESRESPKTLFGKLSTAVKNVRWLYKLLGTTDISDLGEGKAKGTVTGAISKLNTDKVDKVSGKGLSSNDYSTAEKDKLAGIASGANAYSLPLSSSTARGGAKIGYGQNGKNYPVQLSNEQMYVNVPWTDTNTWRGIQNNLTSTSTTDSLSAAQGKILADSLSGKAASNHTHSYLPLSGGTVNGSVVITGQVEVSGAIKCANTYTNTVTNAANMYITSNYNFRRSTASSKRYKHDIRSLTGSLEASKLLTVPVVQYIYNADYLSEEDTRYGKYIPGFIAEDIAELYPIAVETDEEGRPEDWNIRLIVPPMLKLIQDLYDRVDILETRMKAVLNQNIDESRHNRN